MKLPVVKANGNQNSFILIEKPFSDFKLNTQEIINLCKIDNKIVDGLIIIEKINFENFQVDYFNNDGSWETLCINSLRCVGLMVLKKYNLKNFIAQCGDGNHLVEIIDQNNVRVSMNPPVYRSKEIEIDGIKGFYIFAGAKHFVINYKHEWPSNSRLEKIAKKIRYNKIFKNGINVNFYKNNDNNIDVITYEKGIEKIMPSCASGSFACAYHHIFHNNLKNKDIYITNVVGELFAYIDLIKNKFFMSGPAEIEYEKELKFELGKKL